MLSIKNLAYAGSKMPICNSCTYKSQINLIWQVLYNASTYESLVRNSYGTKEKIKLFGRQDHGDGTEARQHI